MKIKNQRNQKKEKIAYANYKNTIKYGKNLIIQENYSIEEASKHLGVEICTLLPGVTNIEKIQTDINDYINSIVNSELKALNEEILVKSDFSDKFYFTPGGKFYHYAKLGGLAQHSLSVTKYADSFYNASSSKK